MIAKRITSALWRPGGTGGVEHPRQWVLTVAGGEQRRGWQGRSPLEHLVKDLDSQGTSAFGRRPSATSSSPRAATLLNDERSRCLIAILAAGTSARIFSIVASPLARSRIAITTSAPAIASRWAKPNPRPLLAPVTTASRPERSGTTRVRASLFTI